MLTKLPLFNATSASTCSSNRAREARQEGATHTFGSRNVSGLNLLYMICIGSLCIRLFVYLTLLLLWAKYVAKYVDMFRH